MSAAHIDRTTYTPTGGLQRKRMGRPVGVKETKPRKRRSDAHLAASYLGDYFAGGNRHHTMHVWLPAMHAARDALPKCEAVASTTGERCRFHAMKGSNRCAHHLRGKERDRLDAAAKQKQLHILSRTSSPQTIARVEKRIATIERRELRRTWRTFPEAAGSTLTLAPDDEQAVHHLLRERASVNIGPGTDLTPRAIDRCRWAGYQLACETIDETRFHKLINGALRDDAKWKAKKSQLPAFGE